MNTNDPGQLTDQLQTSVPAAWHGLTWLHACAMTGAAWAAHTNWARLRSAGEWAQNYCDSRQGGVVPGLWRFVFGRPKTSVVPSAIPPVAEVSFAKTDLPVAGAAGV